MAQNSCMTCIKSLEWT